MTRWFNGGTQPLVPEGKWGDGVIMPGEHYDTDAELSPPWTRDPEAEAQLAAEATSGVLTDADAQAGDTSDSTAEGLSGAEDTPQAPSETVTEPPPDDGPTLHTLDNGDVVNEAGQVVGHINTGGTV